MVFSICGGRKLRYPLPSQIQKTDRLGTPTDKKGNTLTDIKRNQVGARRYKGRLVGADPTLTDIMGRWVGARRLRAENSELGTGGARDLGFMRRGNWLLSNLVNYTNVFK